MTSPVFGGIAGDVFESKQDLRELNLWTLIGCTDERGDAWHRIEGLQGEEDNHYPGFIPAEDVLRRLFFWQPRRADVAYLIPHVGDDVPEDVDGYTVIDGEVFRVVKTQAGRVGVLRDDNDCDLGVFKSGSQHPPYSVTLLREAERLTGTTLGISTAGLLQQGGVAWMEFSLPNACHDPKSGLEYRPNLVRADSMNGSISLTTFLSCCVTVCMNTLTRNMLEASKSGYLFRRKHTSGIVSRSLKDERAALGILEQLDGEFLSEVHALLERPVTEAQRIQVLDIMVPLNDEMTPRSKVLASNKRDRLMSLTSSPMVSPWLGTAFGEVQRYNTADHWQATPKATTQWERNMWRNLTGKRAEADKAVVAALEKVLV